MIGGNSTDTKTHNHFIDMNGPDLNWSPFRPVKKTGVLLGTKNALFAQYIHS
jgi:hypothetical protein